MEIHKIVTQDGYVLTMHHLINPLVSNEERKVLRPVVIMHGLMCSSDDFIMNSHDNIRPKRPNIFERPTSSSDSYMHMNANEQQSTKTINSLNRPTRSQMSSDSSSSSNETIGLERSSRDEFFSSNNNNNHRKQHRIPNALAYTLVNNGYDVWLPNIRGNTYSKEHVTLTNHDRKYWDFSLDELVRYDLPAIISYVQKQSGKTKIAYVGHSQGTATMFALLASQPDLYTDVIEPFIALAPVAYLQHTSSPVRHLIHLRPITKYFTAPVPKRNLAQRLFAPLICLSSRSSQSELCQNTVFLAAGFNERQYDHDRIPVYARHVPAGTSWKVLNHYGQMYSSGEFKMYDYGQSGNQAKYKSVSLTINH